MKKNNDTKDYSEQLQFLNSEPYYASKKILNQSSDFPVRHTGSYRHKKALNFSEYQLTTECQDRVEHYNSGKKSFDSIQFSLPNRFFRFDSIRQSDKFAACTLIFK